MADESSLPLSPFAQLDMTLRRTADGWEMLVSVGEAGLEHAREHVRQRFPVGFPLACVLGTQVACATKDARLLRQVDELLRQPARRGSGAPDTGERRRRDDELRRLNEGTGFRFPGEG